MFHDETGAFEDFGRRRRLKVMLELLGRAAILRLLQDRYRIADRRRIFSLDGVDDSDSFRNGGVGLVNKCRVHITRLDRCERGAHVFGRNDLRL